MLLVSTCIKQIKFTLQIGFAQNNSRYADVCLIFYMQIELYVHKFPVGSKSGKKSKLYKYLY